MRNMGFSGGRMMAGAAVAALAASSMGISVTGIEDHDFRTPTTEGDKVEDSKNEPFTPPESKEEPTEKREKHYASDEDSDEGSTADEADEPADGEAEADEDGDDDSGDDDGEGADADEG